MNNDTTKGVNPPKSPQFTAKTNGIILNGEIHLLALSQSDDPCEDCSIRNQKVVFPDGEPAVRDAVGQ